jgi:hypothetical protein
MTQARTTVVRPTDQALRAAVRLALVFAAIKFVLHLVTNLWEAHIGYGYFRDELYYIMCCRHLAWGYVDHGPGVAIQARLSLALFGKSLAGIRMLSAAGGAGRVFLTGILAWSLGGRRPAQALAMICVVLASQYLGTDSYLSMNSVESIFWMTCLLALILMVRGGSQRLWLLFGLSAGLGLLNKPSMTFFLVALLTNLLLTPQRRLLTNRWAATGVALLILIALPNLLWQIHNHWPTLEFLRNGQLGNKTITLAPLGFIIKQVLNMGPLSVLVWGAGLVHLLRLKDRRWLGLTFVFFFVVMMALHAKDYYLSPIYPILYAAGGIAWELRYARRRAVMEDSAYAFPIIETVLIVGAIVILPLSIPLMPPAQWLSYTRATRLYRFNGNTETASSGPLPQFYADRFGWQEEVDQVTRIYSALPPDRQRITGILCDNYGETSAINFLGNNLPVAISRHNSYYLWGWQGYTFDSMILIEGSTPEHLQEFFDSVQIVGRIGTPYSMPFEHKNIYLVSGRKFEVATEWAERKNYF